MKLVDTNTSSIMNTFQNSYYEQIGNKMIIGSEEYTLASIFSYVLAVYTAMLNASYNNRFLSTAQGEFLDNIASQYNLDRTPVSFGKPFFEGVFNVDSPEIMLEGQYSITIAGHTYLNELVIPQGSVQAFNRFTCIDNHSEYLNKQEIINALNAELITTVEIAGEGLQNCKQVLINDEQFREYIKQNKRLYNSGIAESFEAVAKSYADYITDAKVIRQSEAGFTPGHVDLLLKISDQAVRNQFNSTSVDYKGIEEAITNLNLLVVGQELHIQAAESIRIPGYRITIYVPKSFASHVLTWYVTPKHNALAYYFNRRKLKIGEPFYISEFMAAMSKPLSELSSNPQDFNLTQQMFDGLEPFTIKGFNNPSPDKVEVNSNAFLELLSVFNYIIVLV